MIKQALYKGVLQSKAWTNSKVLELVITNHTEFEFYPGQFISLKVSDTSFRAYSIASDCKDTKHFSLLAAASHEGVGSNYLRNVAEGTELTFIGPSGRFLLPEQLKQNLVFVSTGTGIAPFFSMFYKLQDLNYSGKVTLLQGIRNKTEHIRSDLLEVFSKELTEFNYKICLSETEDLSVRNSAGGRVTKHLEILEDTQYFVCGNPFMVAEVLETLKSGGIDPANIFHEKFTVGTPSQN